MVTEKPMINLFYDEMPPVFFERSLFSFWFLKYAISRIKRQNIEISMKSLNVLRTITVVLHTKGN